MRSKKGILNGTIQNHLVSTREVTCLLGLCHPLKESGLVTTNAWFANLTSSFSLSAYKVSPFTQLPRAPFCLGDGTLSSHEGLNRDNKIFHIYSVAFCFEHLLPEVSSPSSSAIICLALNSQSPPPFGSFPKTSLPSAQHQVKRGTLLPPHSAQLRAAEPQPAGGRHQLAALCSFPGTWRAAWAPPGPPVHCAHRTYTTKDHSAKAGICSRST